MCKYDFLDTKTARESKEYRIWKNMKARCSAPSAKKGTYLNIDVCDEWKNDFEQFYKDMGKIPEGNYSIDRIDNSLGYFKENCRWANAQTQCSNRGSFNRVFTYNGESMVLKDWARKLGIGYSTLHKRITKQKMSFEDAISKPLENKKFLWNNKYYSLKELSEISGIPYKTITSRVSGDKWSIERAINTPVKSNKKDTSSQQ
jgi:predicted transcriptional regulator